MIIPQLKADLIQLKREPIMLLFALISLLIIMVFWSVITFGLPALAPYLSFDPEPYTVYVPILAFLLQPVMMGTVMGFFMLDEKDAGIMTVLSVTPLGISGYLTNRLLLPVILTIVYGLITYAVFCRDIINIGLLLLILMLLSTETVMIGLFIANISEDKVKGLTNSKAVSALTLGAFADLFKWQGVRRIALCTPQYYIARAILEPGLLMILAGIGIHACWLYLILYRTLKRY